MSLNWDWNKKVGTLEAEVHFGKTVETEEVSLYEGNALLIMIYEYKEGDKDMYALWSFWADEQHAKNMLGMNKKGRFTENVFDSDATKVKGIRLNKAKSRNWKKIVKLLTEACDNIKIELYTETDE